MSEKYIIFTDSSCDIDAKILEKWNVKSLSLSFSFDGETSYKNGDMSVSEFYDQMRDGKVARTSAINCGDFETAFKEILDQGMDILYLGFSSGLSGTVSSAKVAAEKLCEEYPERKIVTVDTLAASAGFGLILYLTVNEKKKGADIETAAKFAEDIKLKVCHWFTVSDLVYLKRGGRISPTVAFVGNALGFKPVLHMDDEGHLVNVTKVRGRKNSIAELCNMYGEHAIDKKGGTVFISHGDVKDDAEKLSDMLREKYGVKTSLITNVGPVIGAHSGPGTLALFFIGDKR